MPIALNIFLALLVISIFMLFWFGLAQLLADNSIVDIAWGLGFVLLAWIFLLRTSDASLPQLLLTAAVTLWGLRLSVYILTRKWGGTEDWRYAKWREEWMQIDYSYFLARSLLQVFLLQGVLMVIVALPIIILHVDGGTTQPIPLVAGMLIWVFGFLFESIGDLQLALFKQNPKNKGRIMTSGLWKFTRHPNYLGEVTQWWGLWLLTWGTAWWWIALLSPIVITFLILKVSGISMLEKKYEGNPEFESYKLRTNAFFPWISRKQST